MSTRIKHLLNEGSLVDLTGRQRELGREQLPAPFRGYWAERHAVSTDILERRRSPGLTRDMATLLHAVTQYVGEIVPPARPNYYQYTDARILDWYLASTSDLKGLERLCLDGVHALCDDLRRFEDAFPGSPGIGFDADVDVPSVARRIALLDALLDDLRAKGATPAADAGPFQTVEHYVRANSRTPAILHLTAIPLTRSHDEYTFLRVLQCSELCFFAIRISVSAAIEGIKAQRPAQATTDVETAMVFAGLLCDLLRVLRTMSVPRFAAFRYNTGSASAIQSVNFQLLDLVLHGVNAGKMPHLVRIDHLKGLVRHGDPRFISLRAAVQTIPTAAPAWQSLSDACRRLDRMLLTWRGLHLSFAKTYIPHDGPGTGGTTGAAYLREHLLRGVFDNVEPDWDLIEALFPAAAAPRVRPGVAIAP